MTNKSQFSNISVITVDLGHHCDEWSVELIADLGVRFSSIVELNFTLQHTIGVLLSGGHPSENKHYL
jgi:hypothetical protein